MNDSEQDPDHVDSTLDLRIGEILDRYLESVENGTAVSRSEFLRQHSEIADRLATCLDGVELLDGNLGCQEPLDGNPSSEFQAQTPRVIGDFEILGEIGRGGMGVVYEARERSLDRIVALKVMRFGIVDPRALERFQREAETAGALHHTNIVPVYATGREGDTSWYAMQRIEGESLAQRIDDAYHSEEIRPISIDEIVDIGIQAADALDHAHQRDVVHRDVKPANLIIDNGDRVWLTDFGLARRLVDVGATVTGGLLGTPRYMSPEQADLSKVEIDHRSDIYSLGATLYELTTGIPPFQGNDPLKVISEIRYEDPQSLRKLRASVPRDLEVVLMKCLAKESTRRYATAAGLGEDLRAIRDDRPIQARSTPITEHVARWARKHQGRVRAAAMTSVVTVVLLLLASLGWQRYLESTQGTFRISAAGGPYVATMKSLDVAHRGENTFTVPMQISRSEKRSDYEVMLSGRGNWSRRIHLPVLDGSATEYRLRKMNAPKRAIPVEDALATAVRGNGGAAILWRKDGVLKRMAIAPEDDWQLDVSNVSCELISLGSAGSGQANVSVNFAANLLPDTPWIRTQLDERPRLAAPENALAAEVDLNGDDVPDTLVAATDRAALMAIDHQGEALWSCAYDVHGKFGQPMEFGGSRAPREELTLPGVVDLVEVGDRDQDGIRDVIVQLVKVSPGIQTDVVVVLVSGKSGQPIFVSNQSPLAHKAKGQWPWDGILQLKSGYTFDRSHGIHFSSGVARSYSNSSHYVLDWRPDSRSSTFLPLPSPMQVVKTENEITHVVYFAGKRCSLIDLRTGEFVAPPWELPEPSIGAPRVATVGRNPVLLFTDRERKAHSVATGSKNGTRIAAYAPDGQLRWKRICEFVDRMSSATTLNRPDWPLIADLNQDGKDEVVIPENDRRGRASGLQLLDLATGGELWKPQQLQIATAVRPNIDHIVVTSDLDDDGWRDIATATVAGSGKPSVVRWRNNSTLQDPDRGEAFVYVDWLSGKTGQPITWARFPIPTVTERLEVAEIDGIRYLELGAEEPGLVEVDFLTGDRDELELDSYVLRFHPGSREPRAMAVGLTLVGSRRSVQQGAKTRAYHMRPGPFDDGAESLVLLDETPIPTVRLGENRVIDLWQAKDGRTLAAIDGFDPKRLSVIDVLAQKTVWSTTRGLRSADFFSVRRTDGSVDILQHRRYSDAPILLHGETGRQRWIVEGGSKGRMMHALSTMNAGRERFLLIRDGQRGTRMATNDMLHMSMVDAASGQLLWENEFLWKAARHNRPSSMDGFFHLMDVNGDGVKDIIGPDQEESAELLLVRAWDGRNGETLWTRERFLPGFRTDYFPGPMSTIHVDGEPRLALIEKAGSAEDRHAIVLVDAVNGRECCRYDLGSLPRAINVAKDFQETANLVCWNDEHGKPLLAFVGLSNRGSRQFLLCELSDAAMTPRAVIRPDSKEYNVRGVWLYDVNGDGTPERIEQRKERLDCFDLGSIDPKWRLTLNHSSSRITFARPLGSCRIWSQGRQSGVATLVDLEQGQVLLQRAIRTGGNFPWVVGADRLLVTSKDGVSTVATSPSNKTAAKSFAKDWRATVLPNKDPRRIRHFDVSRRSESVLEIILYGATSSIALVVFVLPCIYVGYMIMVRRWSLSWFLMAPAVLLLFLLVVRASWFHPMLLIDGYIWLATPVGLFCLYRNPQWISNRPIPIAGRQAIWFSLALVVISLVATLSSEWQGIGDNVEFALDVRDISFLLIKCVGYPGRYYAGFLFFFWLFTSRQFRLLTKGQVRGEAAV